MRTIWFETKKLMNTCFNKYGESLAKKRASKLIHERQKGNGYMYRPISGSNKKFELVLQRCQCQFVTIPVSQLNLIWYVEATTKRFLYIRPDSRRKAQTYPPISSGGWKNLPQERGQFSARSRERIESNSLKKRPQLKKSLALKLGRIRLYSPAQRRSNFPKQHHSKTCTVKWKR